MTGNHLTIVRARSISAQPLKSATLIATLLWAASCAFDTSVPNSATGDVPDAARDIDASFEPDADPGNETHLLLTEVKTTVSGKEFIEIYNPGADPISLADYYLADTKEYMRLPAAFNGNAVTPVKTSDFIVRFPAGATIEPNEALVMALRPSDAQEPFELVPDFRIGGVGTGVEMREAHTGSVGSECTLTDMGEGVALFFWDGASDLVADVDLIDPGPNTTGPNRLPNKSNEEVDGPDQDSVGEPYQTDLGGMTDLDTSLEVNQSFQRLSPEAGHESRGGGNGQHGHDETTEDIGTSWGIEEVSPGMTFLAP